MLVFLIPIPSIYAPPSANPDWQSYPYCPGGCSDEYLKTEWAKYYDIKGEEWMEQKKQEMFSEYENGTLNEWIDSDPSKANQNVFTYYFVAGEIPGKDGEYVDEKMHREMMQYYSDNLAEGVVPIGGIRVSVYLFVIIGAIAMVSFVVVWRNRR